MANIKDVFDLTSGSGLIPAAPRERLVKRATTGDWSTFDEDALLVDDRCLPENPHADVEQARANGEWNEDDDDDDDDEEDEEPEEIEEEEQKDEAALLPSPSLRKKRKRQPKASAPAGGVNKPNTMSY